MEEFEAERASLREHLVWMATAAARLKVRVHPQLVPWQ